ncbi:transposase, MuDR, MULE transposase domain protein [Tanacetum coccineum]
MACSLSHTDDEVEALVQKLIDEDMVLQKAILDLALLFENSCTAKADLRQAYEKCNDIPQESRALIDTFLKEGYDKDYELNLSMYEKAAKIEKQMNAKLVWLLEKYNYRSQTHIGGLSSQTHEICDLYLTEKELHQPHLDEEALRETLEEEAMKNNGRRKLGKNKLMIRNSFWNLGCLDIDDSDLHLTPVLRPSSCTRVEPSPSTPNLVRIIPGPAGIVQVVKLLKQRDILLGLDGAVLSTQKYMKKVVEDVGEDEDFKSGSWISVTDYVKANGGTVSGCLEDINNFLINGKLDQVVAIVKSCSPNVLGDLIVTMKNLLGTIPETIHHKVIGEGGYGKDITVGVALILAIVSVFTPKPSMHYLNITMRNAVKVFRKDTVSGSGSG